MQGGKREEESKSNGGRKSKSNGGRESKSRTQDRSKASKASTCVSVRKNNWRRRKAESTDEPEVTGRLAKMRTGRGRSGFVRGRDERCRADEISRKGKGKGNAGKGEHEGKGGEFGRKGKQHETKTRKDENNGKGHELGRMAPNMGAGGSYPRKKKRETRGMRWADCEDDEGKEEEEREQEKEKETRQETRQEELTNEKPPGSEQREESEYQRKRGERKKRVRKRGERRRHERS